MEDGKISYVAELDDKGFAEGARSIQRQVRDVTSRIEKDGSRIDEVFDKIGSRMKQAFAISSIVAFEKKIIDVRSEMESLQKSFESLAGEHIGRKLYEDIKQFATTTPMMAKDLAKGAQTLLGFNIEAEKVMPILRQIGDISMGDAQKFNSLTLAFAQMSSTGKLMGQDLLQMVNAGFNPLVVISEKTGKSIAKLKDEMSEGKITVEMVEEAFRSATAEGGKFHNMLEDQSKTMKGALSNLQGAYEDMLNEIGEKQQGVMLKGVELAQTIVQNYEKVGQVLLGLIATYGTYRTAVMAVSVAEGIANGQIVLKIRALRACAAAQALLNKTMLANPYVLAATALGAVVSALITFRSKSDEASEAQKKLSEAFGETQAKIATEEKNIDSLFGKLRKAVKGTQEYKDAKKAIIDQYGQYFNGLDSEIEKVGGVELAYKKLTKAVRESAMARGKEAAMQQANDTYNSTYSDYIGRIYDTVKETAGEENAKNALRAIRADLKLTGRVAEDTENAIVRVSNGSVKRTWFGEINQAEQNLLETQKKVNAMYGEQKKEADEATNGANNLAEAYKKAEEEFKEANAIVEKMKANRSAYTDEQWNKWTEELKKRKQALEDLGGDPDGKNAKKYANAAKENAELRQKQFDVEMADLERQSKEREEAYNASREAYIASIKNAGERERAAEDEQHRLNIASIKKEAEEMKKANLEAAKKAWEASNTDKTKTWADTPTAKAGWMAQSLTADQEKKITAQLKKEYAERDRLLKERQQKEVQSMRDYMKEFGTLQQKRLAIQQEYDDKIADETDKTQREILEAQKKQALDAFDMEVLKAEIDWTTMFDGIGNALEEEMKATLEKVEKLIQSKAFKGLDAKEQSEYVKLRNELVKKTGGGVGTFDFSIYHKIGEDMKAYQQAIRDAKIAQANQTEAVNNLKEADAELKEAEKNLAKAMNNIASNPQAAEDANRAYLDAKGKKQMADMVAKITGQQQKDAEGNVIVAQGNLINSTTQAQQALDNFGDAISQMTSGSLRGFADGLVNLIAAIGGKNGNGLSGLGKAGGIIAAILSIIDSLGDDFGGFWEKLLDKIFTVIENSMEQTANNKIADSIISAAVNGIKHVIEAMLKGFEEQILGGKITHGLDKTLDALGISHSEEEDAYQKMIAEFENLRDIWDEIIEKKREYLSESWGTEAIKAAEEAKRIADEAIERSRQLARESLDYGASGGSHSIAYRMWDKGSYGDWRGNAANIVSDIKKAGLGDVAFGSMYDMVNMNSKQLSYIRENYRELWVGLDEDYRSALENIIKYGETADDTLKQLDERLTTTTKENVIDEFKETLYSLADGSKDATEKVAENWQKMVNRMVVDNLVMKSMQADLEKWYDDLVALQKERTNGKIDDKTYSDRLEILKGRYSDIVEGGRGMIKTFTEEGIIAPIEEATSEAKKNFESIREAWVSTVMEMKGDSESLGKEIARIMFESIVNEKVFDKEFDTWLEGWTSRLEDAMNVQAPSERESRLNQLAQERADKIEELTSKTKEYAEVTGYSAEATEEFSNSLDNLGDTLLDAMLDTEKDAGQMGAEIGRTLVKEMLQEILKSATYADRIAGIRQMWQDILTGKDTVHTMDDVLADIAQLSNDISTDENIGKLTSKYQLLGEALEGVKTSFGDLSDLMMDSITDVENGAENLRKKLNETLVKDLIKHQQFDVELTVNGVSFENFEAYTKDWSTRYLEALKNNDEELLQSLIDELVEQQQIMAEGAQRLTDTLKKTQTDTTFKDMGNDWVSMLMDMDASASDWGEQIGRTMVEKIMKEMVMGEMMQPFLNNIQEAWNSAVANHDNQDGTFDWEAIANDNGLQTAIGAAGNQFDTLQGVVRGLFQAFHITIDEGTDEDVKKPLENLEDTILEALTDTDMDGEKLAKKIAQDFIREMISTLRDSKFAEEIQDIRDYYQALLDGKEGYTLDELKQNIRAFYKAVSEHPTIEPLIDEWKELNKEIEDTDTIFDNMRDSFRNSIMDMTKTGKDFAQDLKKTFTEEFVDKFVMGEAFDKVMQDFEDDYLKIMGDKSLSKEERAEQGKQIIAAAQKYYEAQKAEAKTWGDLMGINSKEDQSAYMNTAQSFTYDQADLIGGMVTSILMGQTEGNKVRQEILATLRAMDGITNPNSEVFAEMSENISRSANYLSHIEQAVSRIDTAVARNAAAVTGILSKLS